ncbi:MAG: hypothetical protein H6502_02115 [Candidatus Woesearchaeota archaeon]|nr:MAG: hypothetical protein H6502_02115 [Candidatus Woesearchaeota archaeon]
MNEELLRKAKDLGLNSYEAKIWIALLSKGVSSAGELSDIANVPRSRSYDVLESLEKKGFVVMKIGKPIEYIALSPSEVIERVKKRISKDAEKHLDMIEKIKDSDLMTDLTELHNQGIDFVDSTQLSTYIKGRNNIYSEMNSLLKDAKEHVLLLTTEAGLIRKYAHLLSQIKKAHKRGVKTTIGAPLSHLPKKLVDDLQSYVTLVDVKQLPSRFLAVDNNKLLFLVTGEETPESFDVAISVESPFFVNAVTQMTKSVMK